MCGNLEEEINMRLPLGYENKYACKFCMKIIENHIGIEDITNILVRSFLSINEEIWVYIES